MYKPIKVWWRSHSL